MAPLNVLNELNVLNMPKDVSLAYHGPSFVVIRGVVLVKHVRKRTIFDIDAGDFFPLGHAQTYILQPHMRKPAQRASLMFLEEFGFIVPESFCGCSNKK